MIKNIYLKNFLINTVFKGFSFINRICKKNDKVILLYSDTTFRDNTKYLYDYLIENNYNEQYHIICAVKDYEKYNKKKLNLRNVSFISPIQGVIKYLISGHVFYSFGKVPIRPTKNQIVIQMWHGTSFKGFSENQRKTNSNKNKFYTYVYASSEYFRPIVAQKFAVSNEEVFICGHPRTDILYKSEIIYDFKQYSKVILWLPTFRKSTELGMKDGNIDHVIPLVKENEFDDLESFLKEKNILLIIKLHPEQDVSNINIDKFHYLKLMTNSQFIKKGYDLYVLMRHVDAMITDYSSVFYDYLLLNRPIGFTEDDVDEYRDSRGFSVDDPDAFRPGMKMRTLSDLRIFIMNVVEDKDEYESERMKINSITNQYQDGNNCDRTLKISNINIL